VAVRLALAALAVAGAVVAIHALRADHGCADLKADAYRAPNAQLTAIAHRTTARCGDPRDGAQVALIFVGRKRRDAAVEVARDMTRANPDDYLGWLALGQLSGDRRALARAHELNPRGVPLQ
jgi:hypothetical protein